MGYTVHAELTGPWMLGPEKEGAGVRFSWVDVGASAGYVVEISSSLNGQSWAPVEGVSWPIIETTWVYFPTTTKAQFFRVRAVQAE